MRFITKCIDRHEEHCSFSKDEDLCEKNSPLPVNVDEGPPPTSSEIVKWKYVQHVGNNMVWWTLNIEK